MDCASHGLRFPPWSLCPRNRLGTVSPVFPYHVLPRLKHDKHAAPGRERLELESKCMAVICMLPLR